MTTALDTNALLAVLYEDDHTDASEQAIRDAYQRGKLVITPIVYAELAADGHFLDADSLDTFLADFSIDVVEPSRNALFASGEAFAIYLDRRPDGVQCHSCGAEQSVTCDACGSGIHPRQHLAPDFLIGGHAAIDTDGIVSFDSSFYSTYFPSLPVYPG